VVWNSKTIAFECGSTASLEGSMRYAIGSSTSIQGVHDVCGNREVGALLKVEEVHFATVEFLTRKFGAKNGIIEFFGDEEPFAECRQRLAQVVASD